MQSTWSRSGARQKRFPRMAFENLETRRLLAVVTSAADSGVGTLRDALSTGDGTITFDVAAMGTNEIVLLTPILIDSIDDVSGLRIEGFSIVIRGSGSGIPENSQGCFEIDDSDGNPDVVLFRDLTLAQCSAEAHPTGGGAIRNSESLELRNVTLSGNTALNGGAVHSNGRLAVHDSTISDNEASSKGGAIYATSELAIYGSTLTENRAVANDFSLGSGGAVFSTGQLHIHESTLDSNAAVVSGGAIYLNSSGGLQSSIDRTTISTNSSPSGSGIYVNGDAPAMLRFATGGVTLTNSTVSGQQFGAALEVEDAELEMIQSTVSGNLAGGVLAKGEFDVDINFSTIVRNEIASNDIRGAGISVFGNQGSGQVNNSIVAENLLTNSIEPSDIFDRFNDLSFRFTLIGSNLDTELSSSSNAPGVNGNIVGEASMPVDPLLEPLAMNGGLTSTHRVKLHSIAAGSARPGDSRPENNGVINSDQRGLTPFVACANDDNGNGRFTMGSYENDLCRCDFDDNGNYTPEDMGGLSRGIGQAVMEGQMEPFDELDLRYDINYDYEVRLNDVEAWRIAVGNYFGLDAPILPGDTLNSLTGQSPASVVDVSDFNIWNANKFTSGTSWLEGDFNTDGRVDVSDFNIWNANKFTQSSPAQATGSFSYVEPANPFSREKSKVMRQRGLVLEAVFLDQSIHESSPSYASFSRQSPQS